VLNLLDLSRIKVSGVDIELKPTDATEVVRSCEKIVRGEAERRHQRISTEIAANLPLVLADHSALRRALCAVAENAIKFTPEDGRIVFRAQFGDEVKIEIEDTGRGIAEEDLPRVFEKFYRGRNASGGALQASDEEVPGIGLGLNLTKTLIEGMCGTIDVESRLGKGTKFTVRLPVWTGKTDELKIESNKSALEDTPKTTEISGANGRSGKYEQKIANR
jgi:signal transduction histidine kinase